MSMPSGTKLGRYEIRSKMGAGGMGEVYRATDPKICRDVAIKVLPADFSADHERVIRFEQEAQAVGAVAGIFAGRPIWETAPPAYQRLTFNRGTIWNARFAPDGRSVVYSATWNGGALDVFSVRAGNTESRSLKLENTDVLAISASNELAVLRNRQQIGLFLSHGTLARMPIDGGAARDVVEDVQEADWSPDGTELVIVRWVNGLNQLEYPVGRVLYKSAGHLNHPRISPKGDRIAVMDHPTQFNTRGWVVVVDLTGKKTVVSGEMANQEGLAWTPAGDEVWFTGNKKGEADALYAISLSGRERLVLRTTSRLMLHDISRDGRALLTSFNSGYNIVSQPPGETKERDLSWLDQGSATDLSPDGKTILIEYVGEGAGTNGATYLRRTDGSPAVRLGDGNGPRLSPDGKQALAVRFTPPQLVLLPTGAGEARVLERGPIEQYAWGRSGFRTGSESPSWAVNRVAIGAATFRVLMVEILSRLRLREPGKGS